MAEMLRLTNNNLGDIGPGYTIKTRTKEEWKELDEHREKLREQRRERRRNRK